MAEKANVQGTQKAALTQTLIARKKSTGKFPSPTEWYRVARGITEVSNESESETESYSDYSGNGNTVEVVNSVTSAYAFSGDFYYGDPAHELVRELKDETGTGTEVWAIRVSADGAYELGEAVLSGIKIGGGESSGNDAIEFTIGFKAGLEKGFTLPKTKDIMEPDIWGNLTRKSGADYSSNK